MVEAALVIGPDGCVLHLHLPPGVTSGSIPDSARLWEVLWQNRGLVEGVAHLHPGRGEPCPSETDLTTFAAIEAGLGRRLCWWISSSDHTLEIRWRGPNRLDYAEELVIAPRWVVVLRLLGQAPLPGSRWLHPKRGTSYRVDDVRTLQAGLESAAWSLDGALAVCYTGEQDGLRWVRPLFEFLDGRFRPLPEPDHA